MNKYLYLVILLAISFSQSPLNERYHTYSDIVDSLMMWNQNFSENPNPSPYYPNSGIIFKLEEIGSSHEDDLPIYAVKLSFNADQTLDKPRVLILGQCHSEEILGVEISMSLIERFLYPQNYPSDINTLIGVLYNAEIWIVPTHNPEGHTVVHGWNDENGQWMQDVTYRKNKHDVNGNGIFDFNPQGFGNDLDGVDLNRNYDFNWIFGDPVNSLDSGCSGNPSYISHYDYYRGADPFSEKEIQAIRDFAIQKNFLLSIAYHSSRSGCVSERVIYPWLWAGGKAAPDYSVISQLGREIAELIPVEVGDGNYHNAPSGSRRGNAHDWFYAKTGCIQYLIEVGTENMQPNDTELINDTVERNIEGAYHLLRRAAGINLGNGPEKFQVTGIVTDAITNMPITAEVKIMELDSPILSPRLTDNFGRYRRLLNAGTFTLEISAFGYETFTVNEVVPTSSSITVVDVALNPLPNHTLTLNVNLPSNYEQDVKMIRSYNSKIDTFSVQRLNNFQWPTGEYDLLFLSQDIYPEKKNITLTSSETLDINLEWYEISFYDNFDSMQNWNIVHGDWVVDNGVLKSQSDLVYEDYSPLGPSRLDLNIPLISDDYFGYIIDNEIVISLLMKNELEWEKDIFFIDVYNYSDSLNVLSLSNHNWVKHYKYIHSNLSQPTSFLTMGINSDITLGYRGIEIDEMKIYFRSSEGCKLGDFNHDGQLDIADIVGLVNHIVGSTLLSGFQICVSDLNDDSFVDLLDIILLLNVILEDE